MSPVNVMNTALSGMQAQSARLGALAETVAHGDAADFIPFDDKPLSVPNGGGAERVAAVSEAKFGFTAAVAAFDSGADLWDALRLVRRD